MRSRQIGGSNSLTNSSPFCSRFNARWERAALARWTPIERRFFSLPTKRVEQTVASLIRDGRWPVLGAAAVNSLYHRGSLAKGLLLKIIDGEELALRVPTPDPDDRQAWITWIFV